MTVKEFADEHPIVFQVVGWALMIVFGPALFPSTVGPGRHVDWRLFATALAGCLLWGSVIFWIFGFPWETL